MKTQQETVGGTFHMKPEVLHFGLGFVTNLLGDLDHHLTDSSDTEAEQCTNTYLKGCSACLTRLAGVQMR